MSPLYLWLETRRQLRDVRSLVFTFGVPIVMLLIFGGAYGSYTDPTSKLRYTVILTVQMAAYGGMIAALQQSNPIVTERSLGWNRQLRITPLTGFGYLVSKVTVGLVCSLASILLVSIVSAAALQTSQSAAHWVLSILALWVGSLPFALVAVVIGQFAKPQYAQPLFLVVFFGFSILGGLWVPLSILPSWVTNVAQVFPSYWLNQFGQMGAGTPGQLWHPIAVLVGWTIVLGVFISWRYRHDSSRG